MRTFVAALVAVALVGCSPETAPVSEPPPKSRWPKSERVAAPRPTPTPDAQQESALIYIRHNVIRSFGLSSGEDERIAEVATPDVTLAPDGSSYALVTDHAPGTDPEGYGDPYISIHPLHGGAPNELGPGRSPMFSPDGSQISAVQADGVVVYDVETGAESSVLEGEGWSVIGWSGDRLVAVGSQGTVAAAPNEEPRPVKIPPNLLWGVSPAVPRALIIESDQVSFSSFDKSARVPSDIAPLLGDGAWAPDGNRVAVTVLSGRGHLELVDPSSGVASTLDGSEGAQGNVVWSGDGATFAYVRVDPSDRTRLQAVVCTVDEACEQAFSWSEGVRLLGLSTSQR